MPLGPSDCLLRFVAPELNLHLPGGLENKPTIVAQGGVQNNLDLVTPCRDTHTITSSAVECLRDMAECGTTTVVEILLTPSLIKSKLNSSSKL